MFKKIILGLINLYKIVLSPFLPRSCRHIPSCSRYAHEAIDIHGIGKGSWMALKRICRCHPWGTFGFDPVNKDKR